MFKLSGSALKNSSGLPENTSEQNRSASLAVRPVMQPASVQALSASPGNQLAMLQERWDSHAATALQILTAKSAADGNRMDLNPLLMLRQAANLRLQNLRGEQQNRLAEVSQRDDRLGLFAKSEMQADSPAFTPVLPLFNLPRRDDRPFLDGKLTESIWESAAEITLQPFVRIVASSDTAEFTQQAKSGESSVSSLVMFAWDEQFLYLAARLERPPQKVKSVELATYRSHDAAHGDRDRVELELDTDRDFGTSFQLSIDESGLTSDRCWMLDKWNPEWFVAVDSDEAAWRLEAAIPLVELSAPLAKPGDLWSFRLRRIVPGILQHELLPETRSESTSGTGLLRFIRPKVVTKSRSRK